MREAFRIQENSSDIPLGFERIGDVQLDPRSRESVTRTLAGIQCVYRNDSARKRIIDEIRAIVSDQVCSDIGRKGLDYWSMFVFAVLRLSNNWSYDVLENMVNNHHDIRGMVGLNSWRDQEIRFSRQTLHENLSRLTAEALDRISDTIVEAAYQELPLSKDFLLGRCDSFVVESNVHFPTDLNLLLDCVRKSIDLATQLSMFYNLKGWREHKSLFSKVKRLYTRLSRMRASRCKDPLKQQSSHEKIKRCCSDYLVCSRSLFDKVQSSLSFIETGRLSETIEYFIGHGRTLCDQIHRRIIKDEKIAHDEKIFSVFEPYTEWIVKGKAGVRQELGVRVCIVEDHHGFLLNHRVMYGERDEEMVVELMKRTKQKYPSFSSCSFDKGFHSRKDANGKTTRDYIEELDIQAYLPVKGRPNKIAEDRQSQIEFRQARRQHSAVESAINSLEHHGLDTCPDRGQEAFSRYIAAACCGFNLHRLGTLILRREAQILQAA